MQEAGISKGAAIAIDDLLDNCVRVKAAENTLSHATALQESGVILGKLL